MSGNGGNGGGNGGNGGGGGNGGNFGGTPLQIPQGLIPSSTTVLQPGSRYFRLVDAFAQLDSQQAIAVLQQQVGTLEGDITALQSSIATLQSQMSTVQGQITTLQGQVQALQLFMNSFNYNQIEVSTSTIFLDQRTIYRRSFVINGALNTAVNVFTYPHGVPAISYIVNIQAMAGAATAMQYPITFLNMATAPSLSTGISCWADATNIYIANGTTAFSGIQVLATMWYTATNR